MVNIKSIVLGERKPTGTALIMLHGWNRSAEDMLPLGELLAQAMEVHLLDLPGFGKSDMPDGDWDTQQYAERIRQYIADCNLEKVNLIGHSFGGRISLRLAKSYPELVENLVLMASHGLKRKRSPLAALKIKLIPKLGKFLKFIDKICGLNLYRDRFIVRFGSPDYLKAGPLRGTFVKVINEDQSADVAKIKTSTLLLWGDKDSETPLEMGKEFNRLMTNSRLIVLPEKGHDIFQDVDAHLCAYYVLKFLVGNCAQARETSNA